MYVQTGSIIDGKFEVLGTIGSGGMGVVYETLQQGLERKVALKVLTCLSSSNAEELARFDREAFVLSKLSHPNIVQFYSYGVWVNSPYIAMERLSGASLQEQLRANEALDFEYSFKVVATLCGALEHAHVQNIFHRDLKPSNIIMCNGGDVSELKVIDFGLAKILGSEVHQKLTKTGLAVGSVLYMSPEQCIGEVVDARTDIYSIGCLLHHLLAGVPPFRADSAPAVMFQHLHESIENGAEWSMIPPEAQQIILKCTAKQREERYATAMDLKNDLDDVLRSGGGADAGPRTVLRAQSGGAVDLAKPKPQNVKSSTGKSGALHSANAVVLMSIGAVTIFSMFLLWTLPVSLVPNDQTARNIGLLLDRLGLFDAEVKFYTKYAQRNLEESGFNPTAISHFDPAYNKVSSYSRFTLYAVEASARANPEGQSEFATESFFRLRQLVRGDGNGNVWLSQDTFNKVLQDNAAAMKLIPGIDTTPSGKVGLEGVGLGALLDQRDMIDLAEWVLLRSLKNIERTNREHYSGLSEVTFSLADNYVHQAGRAKNTQDLERALFFYDRSARYRRNSNAPPHFEAVLHADKAEVLRLLNRPTEADKEQELALAYLNKAQSSPSELPTEILKRSEYFWNQVMRVAMYAGDSRRIAQAKAKLEQARHALDVFKESGP